MDLDVLALGSLIALALIWVGYPLVVAALAGLRRAPADPAEDRPQVSVVIATREPDDAVLARVRNVLDTAYPADRLDVIVAHGPDRSIAALDGLAGAGSRVRAARAAGRGKAASLNAGVAASSGSVVVFADTYQRFDRDTIPILVGNVLRPGTGAVSGSLQLAPGTGAVVAAYWSFERWLREAEARLHSAIGATGAVWALRRDLWTPLPEGLILDDVYTPMRVVLAGRRVGFAAGARAYETRTPTPAQEYGRKVRTLTGVVQLCAWLPPVLAPWRNPVWLQFTFHKLLRMLTPYLVTLIGLWAVFRGVAAVGPRTLLVGGAGAAAGFAWLLLTRRAWGRRVRQLAAEGVLIQVAVLMAGLNGLRGHWQVWDG